MKKIVVLIALSIMVSSCDSPRAQRSVLGSSGSNAATVAGNGVSFGNSGTVTETVTDTTDSTSTVPTDAKHCKFSKDGVSGFESTSSHLGSYTLCQSSSDKTVFYAQFKTPPVGSAGDVSVCFIPHTTTGSNSIYVGNPMCGSFPNPKEVKKITFVKYTQYGEAHINSVMFFKDTSYYYPTFNRTMMTLDAYKQCMSYLAYGNSAYCAAFKSVNQYVLKSF